MQPVTFLVEWLHWPGCLLAIKVFPLSTAETQYNIYLTSTTHQALLQAPFLDVLLFSYDYPIK